MKNRIHLTNEWLFKNLFWIVPAFALILVGDVFLGVFHSSKSLNNQEVMKSGITATIHNDSLQLANQDSVKSNQRKIDSVAIKWEQSFEKFQKSGK